MPYKSKRTCFVIGPMKDINDAAGTRRLERLKKHVLEPIFEDIYQHENIRYTVVTPFDLPATGTADIVLNVLDMIDKADLIVADLSDGNPNVFYELGISHSLGRPTVLLMEKKENAAIEFYLRRYFVPLVELDADTPQKYLEARHALESIIRRVNKDISDWRSFKNPVTDVFQAPITYISPSFSLAQGYFRNFIAPSVEAIIKVNPYGKYEQSLGFGLVRDSDNQDSRIDNDTLVSDDIRRQLVLNIIVPAETAYAREIYISRFQGKLQNMYIDARSRIRTVQYRERSDNVPELVDIPTTILTMESAIERRMTDRTDRPGSERWKQVERQEIERFYSNLQLLIDTHPDNPLFKQHVKVTLYDPDAPSDELQWLHRALQF